MSKSCKVLYTGQFFPRHISKGTSLVRLLLIGTGGHCSACIDVVETMKRYSIVGLVSREPTEQGSVCGYPILGSDQDLPSLIQTTEQVLIAVGQTRSVEPRRGIFELLEGLQATFATVVSPFSYVAPSAQLGRGVIVMHRAIISSLAEVGDNSIVNSAALLEHGVKVGRHCHVSTGAIVNGSASVGEGSFIGSGAIVREGVSIGPGSVIGAGVLVGSDVPPSTTIRASWAGRG